MLAGSLRSSVELVNNFWDQNRVPCILSDGNYGATSYSKSNENLNVLDDVIVWMAAPKKRTSRKTKWLRHQRKFIKVREDIDTCSVCGNAKLMNHLCGSCFERVERETEQVLKEMQSRPGFWRSAIPETLKQFYRK